MTDIMKILAIETSCDETALAIVEVDGGISRSASARAIRRDEPQFKVIAEALNSQTKIHEKYGGVYPMMAKREHSKNLIPLLKTLLKEEGGNFWESKVEGQKSKVKKEIEKILEREPELLEQIIEYLPTLPKPDIDAIAVTYGPGLEPALWVGINFGKALGYTWNIPVIPINHMEGHVLSALMPSSVPTEVKGQRSKVKSIQFPALALLISGGHTELVLMKDWQKYEILGQTRDDAVGEAFDKVARMMGLPYPGGPEISRLAEKNRNEQKATKLRGRTPQLPRPMIKSGDYDFSFSGLKTAVLYTIQKMSKEEKESLEWKQGLSKEFEDAVTEVLISKTRRAIEEFGVKTLIVGGGVIANEHLRQSFQDLICDFPNSKLLIPDSSLSTDNAVMIAVAGYFNFLSNPRPELDFKAVGNLKLASL